MTPPNITDDMPHPVVIIEPKTLNISWANHSAQSWMGTSLKRLQGKTVTDVFNDEGVLQSACEKVLETMAPVHIHDYLSKKFVHEKLELEVTVFPSGDHLVGQFIESSSQNTSGKANLTMSAMGRMLAHEIKNPLAGINGAAQLIRDDVVTSEGHALVDLIETEIDRIRRLADRMERLGDQDPDLTSDVNIHEIIRHARRIMEPALSENIMFTEHFDPSLPLLIGDPDTLIQAIINLIKNAAEAINQSGVGDVIMLETAYLSGVSRRVGEDEKAQHLPVLLRVSDNGPGIHKDIRKRLFQPFITSKPSGQGLGLALVSKVALAHGGAVEVGNKNGWTEFSIRLPAPDQSEAG